MTFREILIEFSNRRQGSNSFDHDVDELMWAIQAMLERLAEKEESHP